MYNNAIGATPRIELLGTQDNSKVSVPRETVSIPQHLAKFYLFCQKGPTKPQLISGGAEFENMYGSESLNQISKYYNHQTAYFDCNNSHGTTSVIQRVIPEDAGPESNVTIWMDVLPTTVDRYKRNFDGSITMDTYGDPIVTGTAPGYKVKFTTSVSSNKVDAGRFGTRNITAGDQVDTVTNVTSQRYPIMEFKSSSVGEYGNSVGFRLWAPTIKTQLYVSSKIMSTQFAYPYKMSVIKKPVSVVTPKIVETTMGSQNVELTFKPGTSDPDTFRQLYAGDTFLSSYQNLQDLDFPLIYGDIGNMFVYSNNIDQLLTMFHSAEKNYLNSYSDFTDDPAQKHLFNFVGGTSSYGVPYETFIFVDQVDSVRFNENQNIYLGGGSDGTLNDRVHGDLVKTDLERYMDPNDIYQDRVESPERVLYDSGYPTDVKLEMAKFISIRTDTYVVLSTHISGDQPLSGENELSLAIALRTKLRHYPESVIFGTETCRAFMFRDTGLIRNSLWTKRVPQSYEFLDKSAAYMGASEGKWKQGENFSGEPKHILTKLYDLSSPFVPFYARNRYWSIGLNGATKFDSRSYCFLAYKSVYSDDTSVLNSPYVIMAICEINAILDETWRAFSGKEDLTPAQLEDRVNNRITKRTEGRFDNMFVIKPRAIHTELDAKRGYAITVPVDIYANNMTTVFTGYVRAFRKTSLPTN